MYTGFNTHGLCWLSHKSRLNWAISIWDIIDCDNPKIFINGFELIFKYLAKHYPRVLRYFYYQWDDVTNYNQLKTTHHLSEREILANLFFKRPDLINLLKMSKIHKFIAKSI